jgi:hypothetical protein
MKRRVAVAVAVGLVFYALGDVLLRQRIFEVHHLYQYDAAYQTGMVRLYEAGLWAIWYAVGRVPGGGDAT